MLRAQMLTFCVGSDEYDAAVYPTFVFALFHVDWRIVAVAILGLGAVPLGPAIDVAVWTE